MKANEENTQYGSNNKTQGELKEIWVDSVCSWLESEKAHHWVPYYINIMFKPLLKGSNRKILSRMQAAIERDFYPRFLRQFVRHPTANTIAKSAPKLILFPDLPVYKRNKGGGSSSALNSGLHYNGTLMIPTLSRNKQGPQAIIDRKSHLFYRGDIERVVIIKMNTPEICSDYQAKTILSKRASEDHIVLLPRSMSEVRSKSSVLNLKTRKIRDLMSEQNISEENAHAIIGT